MNSTNENNSNYMVEIVAAKYVYRHIILLRSNLINIKVVKQNWSK